MDDDRREGRILDLQKEKRTIIQERGPIQKFPRHIKVSGDPLEKVNTSRGQRKRRTHGGGRRKGVKTLKKRKLYRSMVISGIVGGGGGSRLRQSEPSPLEHGEEGNNKKPRSHQKKRASNYLSGHLSVILKGE